MQAQHDLEFGRLALREGYFAQACFIAQQSAEKAVKSLAYGAGERQAREAIEGAEKLVGVAEEGLRLR